MRICFAGTFNFPEGGAAARAVHLQAKGLAERGHKVSIFVCRGTWETGNILNYDGLKVFCYCTTRCNLFLLPSKLLWFLSQLWILLKLSILTITSQYDQIFFYGAAPIFAPIVLLSRIFRRNSAFIQYDLLTLDYKVSILSNFYRRLILLSEKILASCATLQIIGCSSMLKERMQLIGNPSKQLCLWPPTNVRYFASGNAAAVREQYSFHGKKVVLYSGALTNLEGIHILIRAMANVTTVHPDAVLVLVGGAQAIDPAYKGQMNYQKMVHDLALNESVIFTGLVEMDCVPDFLAAADVLVMPKINHPANHAASPIKIGEYLAAGKPVVSSRICELDVWLKNRIDILFCEPDDFVDLANKICELLSNAALANIIATNGFDVAKRICDYPIWAQHIHEAITDVSDK